MKKLNTRAGFTLAELLIVVAIIAVLVAIAIPVFNSQLEKSRDTTDSANLRAAYSEAVTCYFGGVDVSGSYTASSYTFTKAVKKMGSDTTWTETPDFGQGIPVPTPFSGAAGTAGTVTIVFTGDGKVSSFDWVASSNDEPEEPEVPGGGGG